MSIMEALESFNAGWIVGVIVLILSLVEIAPIKVSPLKWIGKRVNGETLDKVAQIEKKLDEHIAQSYRNKILMFQDDIQANKPKTKEQWKEIVNAISAYAVYCTENKITNGLCKEASEYLLEEYRSRLRTRNFAPDLVQEDNNEETN